MAEFPKKTFDGIYDRKRAEAIARIRYPRVALGCDSKLYDMTFPDTPLHVGSLAASGVDGGSWVICWNDGTVTQKGDGSDARPQPVAKPEPSATDFSLANFEKQCVRFTDPNSTCLTQGKPELCPVCQAVREIKRLRATIRRYRMMAKHCGSIAYMAEHPEEMEPDHEPFV